MVTGRLLAALGIAGLAISVGGCRHHDCRTRAEMHCGVTYSGFSQQEKQACLDAEHARCDCMRDGRSDCNGDAASHPPT